MADHRSVVFAACGNLVRMKSTAEEGRAVRMRYGPGDLERYHRRVQKQKRYQRIHRERQADEGIPERDDVAKVVLSAVLDRCARDPKTAESFIERTAADLTKEKKRFDKHRSAEVLRAMVERHREGLEREARRRAAER